MSITVASFLREKLQNMERWLSEDGCELRLPAMQDVHIVALAQALHDKFADVIEQRDFAPLANDKENLPMDMVKLLQYVEARPDLHDKFWRYLKLFSDTVSVHGG